MHGLQTLIKNQEAAAARVLHPDEQERVAVAKAISAREAKDAVARLAEQHRVDSEERLALRVAGGNWKGGPIGYVDSTGTVHPTP